MSDRRANAAIAALIAATMGACGSSSASGAGAVCSTFNVGSNVYDENGMDLCEMYVTTSGSSECGTLVGIPAETPGACPTKGLIGCCVLDLASSGFPDGTVAASCWYDAEGANEGRVGCNGPDDTWQAGPP
jgi:hypothetical protein